MRSAAASHVIPAYAQWGRVQMADAEAEAAPRPEMQRLVAALRARLWQLQTELREQEVSEASSRAYCRGFCQVVYFAIPFWEDVYLTVYRNNRSSLFVRFQNSCFSSCRMLLLRTAIHYFSMLAVGVHRNIFYLFWKYIESPSKALLMHDPT